MVIRMKNAYESENEKQSYHHKKIRNLIGSLSPCLLLCLLCFTLAGCTAQDAGKNSLRSSVDSVNSSQNLSGSLDSVQESHSEETVSASEGLSQATGQTSSQLIPQDSEEDSAASVSLIMVGDILLHTPVEESAQRSDGSYDFTAIFANVKEEIQSADLSLVNQEVIIGGTELGISGYPAFNAPYEIGDALVNAGFDVICHGTNHTLDKGRKGVQNCLNFWRENYPEIAVLGIHDSQESQDTIYVYEQSGIKIAILNYTYGTNGIPLPEDMPFAVDLLDKERVAADLQEAEKIADFTVVCPHWGTEYALGISAAQKEWTQIFLKNGADLVLGTHPHVIEPIEWVKDEEQGLEMLVYYSLGNFVNWTSGTREGVANRMVGGMAQVTLERAEDGRVSIKDYGVMPLVCHVEKGMDGVTVYALEDYTKELAERNAIIQQDSTFSLEYCRELCDKVWGEER